MIDDGARPSYATLPVGRAWLLRQAAIFCAALLAYVWRAELARGSTVISIFACAAALNLGTLWISGVEKWQSAARWLSIAFGLAGWGALLTSTGGCNSPFVAGLCLEIVFSALVFAPSGTIVTTLVALAVLVLQQALPEARTAGGRVAICLAFVAATGALTFLASRRWVLVEQQLARNSAELSGRLLTLERELEDAKQLTELGERAGRLAHGLKNAVHSLRGFSSLIEAGSGNATQRRAIDGLERAIDGLENLTKLTLHGSPELRSASVTSAADVSRTMAEVIAEVGRVHRGVKWITPSCEILADVAFSSSALRECLLVLTENAAEASGASGSVVLRASVGKRRLQLLVEDQGVGIPRELEHSLFRPGVTTKLTGNGFGIFLARRLAEAQGGELTARRPVHGGAQFALSLPLREE